MKFKKILLSASALAAGSSLIATALVSCSKSSIDEDLKISLNDEGKLIGKYDLSYKDAIKYALSRSSSWTTFKQAFADELVFKWYTDRMADSKESTEKNTTFRINYEDWKYQIEKDYDEIVKNCKSKYSNNWQFYLQNDYLAPYGGTRDGYIHSKLVDKVKADFVSKVFATSYFGYATGDETEYLPRAFTPATKTIDATKLNDPATWPKLGFYARVNSGFSPTIPASREAIDYKYLAKYPDGDYATIQNYVFERWFKYEKPFFSSAALFKYSIPKHVASGKLAEIYDGTYTGAKIPDACNESFPFFGFSEYGKGTKAYQAWFNAQQAGEFEADTYLKGGEYIENGTTSMKKKYTEDSQTLLLVTANSMLTTATGSLYVPYAMAASHLYQQMLGIESATDVNNTMTEATLIEKVKKVDDEKDDFAILSNFFYTEDPSTSGIKSFLDLNEVYGGLNGDEYHCPLFKDAKDYTYLYGDTTAATAAARSGVRYITNNVQVDLTVKNPATGLSATQPWVLELNEAGMHAQTIDGYRYVSQTANDTPAKKQEALKNVLKYRLMQKKCDYNKEIISCNLFEDAGLKTYFNDNFANIILEMAAETDDNNIFRPIADYQKTTAQSGKLFETIINEQGFESAKNISDYLTAIITYDIEKKMYDSYVGANTRIYDYRKKQIENSKFDPKSKTVFENGLLAPIPYDYIDGMKDFETTRLYKSTCDVMMLWEGAIYSITHDTVTSAMDAVEKQQLLSSIDNVTVNSTNAFSPQITAAKNETSNRFWYKSYIVDKMMYAFMGTKSLVNEIKSGTYNAYFNSIIKTDDQWKLNNTAAIQAFASVYAQPKLLTGDKNYSSYQSDKASTETYWDVLNTNYQTYMDDKQLADGYYCDEYMNLELYLATCAYLMKDNFANFYKVLNAKISDDEKALVGYVNKFDVNHEDEEYLKPIEKISTASTNYDWSADVNNIYDQHKYLGNDHEAITDYNSRIACDQYWNVVSKDFGVADVDAKTLAGFTGIQTKSSNQLDSSSGLQAAAFTNFAQSSLETYDLTTGTAQAQNKGCWFAWEGQYTDSTKKTQYSFNDVAWKKDASTTVTVKASDFDHDGTRVMLKLAKRIASDSTIDSLRTLAKSLGDSFMGNSLFKEIGNGTHTITSSDVINEMKVAMLQELLSTDAQTGEYVYAKCFERLTNAQLHTECTSIGSASWYFQDKNLAYQLLMTQINKSDIIEQRLTPTADGKTWKMVDSPITLEEFFNIFNKCAMESSVQQLVISDAVKNAFGDDKLVIYDAQLYNQFDSTWIKDWKKKPIGGEGK